MPLSHFDWYEATIPNIYPEESNSFGFRLLLDYIEAEKLAGENFYSEREKGFQHYQTALSFYDENRIAHFRILLNPNQPAHFIASGKRAAVLSDLVRKYEPNHYVTRADSALDFVGDPEGFKNVCQKVISCRNASTGRRGRKLGVTTIHQDTGGDTLYLGSMKSESFLRVYDKAAEQKQLLPKHLHSDIPADWTRVEIVARPGAKEQRYFLAKCDPDSVWSFNPACADFLRYLKESESAIKPASTPYTEDFNRAWWAFLYQYRKVLIDRAQNRCRGSWQQLGELIEDDLKKANLL